jgi:hypothetical protein
MKDSRPNLPRPSQIVDRMMQGHKYTPTQMAFLFDANLAGMQKLLKALLADGAICCNPNGKGRERQYHLPVIEETPPAPATSRAVHAFTPPLDGSMARARIEFMAGCLAVRRS